MPGCLYKVQPFYATKFRTALYQQLESVFQQPDLLQPLKHLTSLLRSGGNLGAHFDYDKEVTEDLATVMFDFLDFLLEYTFVLRERAKAIEEEIKKAS